MHGTCSHRALHVVIKCTHECSQTCQTCACYIYMVMHGLINNCIRQVDQTGTHATFEVCMSARHCLLYIHSTSRHDLIWCTIYAIYRYILFYVINQVYIYVWVEIYIIRNVLLISHLHHHVYRCMVLCTCLHMCINMLCNNTYKSAVYKSNKMCST